MSPLLMLASGSCIFELPELQKEAAGGTAGFDGIGGSPSGGGASPDQGGTTNGGGSAGTDVGSPCDPGEKLCADGECRPATPEFGCSSSACQRCGSPPGAVVGCVEGQCAVSNCQPGLADCNGDVLDDRGEIAGDGCEYSLGLPAAPVTSLSVPFGHIQVDGERSDWGVVPAYSFEELCPNCNDQQTPPISADSSIPPRSDLDATFRVAWDGDFFYVLVEAYDNHLFDQGSPDIDRCQGGAECEDALQVFFDGRNDRTNNPEGGYSNDDHRVFTGLSRRFFAPAQGQPQSVDVAVVSARQGNSCYRIEAQFDWQYITGTRGGGQAPGQFPPLPGQSYGFDIAINDWDPTISDQSVFQRQSQLFWADPGPNYPNKPIGFSPMLLLGGADAGP